jgi:hypothetical protein
MAEMKPFSEHDWYGFAGATDDDDHPALIGDITVEGFGGATVVADLKCVQVLVADDGEQIGAIWSLEGAYPVNVLIAKSLPVSLGKLQLESMGFERIA